MGGGGYMFTCLNQQTPQGKTRFSMRLTGRFSVAAAIIFAMASHLLYEPATAASTGVATSVESLNAFYHSFEWKKGTYYVVSPEIIGGPFGWRNGYIAVDQRRLELESGYIVLYGQSEKLAARLGLARENMKVIRSHLADSFAKHGAEPLQVGGEFTVGKLGEADNQFCGFDILDGQSAFLAELTTGNWVSTKQLCVGFGVAAALGGYRIVPTKQGLELRHEFDVKQGAAIGGEHAPNIPHSSATSSLETS